MKQNSTDTQTQNRSANRVFVASLTQGFHPECQSLPHTEKKIELPRSTATREGRPPPPPQSGRGAARSNGACASRGQRSAVSPAPGRPWLPPRLLAALSHPIRLHSQRALIPHQTPPTLRLFTRLLTLEGGRGDFYLSHRSSGEAADPCAKYMEEGMQPAGEPLVSLIASQSISSSFLHFSAINGNEKHTLHHFLQKNKQKKDEPSVCLHFLNAVKKKKHRSASESAGVRPTSSRR